MRALFALTACLVLAGCSGKDVNNDATLPAAEGTPGSGGAEENVAGASTPMGMPAPVFEAVSWQGDVGTHDCVWLPGLPGSCIVGSMGPPTDPMNRDSVVYMAQTQGPASLSGNLTLEWQETSPLTHAITVLINSYLCDPTCTEDGELGRVSGTSPLTIPLDGLNLTADQRVGFFLRPSANQAAGAQVVVGAGQPVLLEGEIGYHPLM